MIGVGLEHQEPLQAISQAQVKRYGASSTHEDAESKRVLVLKPMDNLTVFRKLVEQAVLDVLEAMAKVSDETKCDHMLVWQLGKLYR